MESEKYLRLTTPPVWVGEGDFGIVIDLEKEGDEVFEIEGQKLLLVDESLAQRLSKSVLDFKDPPDGPRFALDVY